MDHKILSINGISISIKGHNSVENEQKILFNHPNLHLVNINAYTKFDQNPQINSQDIEHKQNSFICSEDTKKHIFTSVKGHNSVENEQKILFNQPNLRLININAYTKFCRNPQDMEHKQNSDVDQGS